MKKLINESTLRTQKLAGIISENQYNEGMEANRAVEELKAQAFELANSAEMDDLVDNILAKASPEDLEAMQVAMQDIASETGMMNEGVGDFSSFSKVVDLSIDAAGDGVMEEEDLGRDWVGNPITEKKSELSKKIGAVLDKIGTFNIMSMGFLPSLTALGLDSFAGTDILNTAAQAVGGGGVAAVLSVIAGLVGGSFLWKLGKKLQGVKVGDHTTIAE
jgi:hypothetical protein